jgi:3-oxoacyl-[acyl-carrier-protein] synthase II
MKRVAITGIGAITPIGHGVDGLWRGMLAGRSAVRRLDRFDPSPFRSQVAAQVDDFDPRQHLDPKQARRLDRCSQFAVAAAGQAVRDAGLLLSAVEREQTGVFLGTALGGVAFGEEQHQAYLRKGVSAVSLNLALSVFAGAAGCNVGMELGLHGPNVSNGNSCASGAVAIGEAFKYLRHDGASVALAGGAEAPLAPLTFGSFALIRAMSTRNHEPSTASRPFDAERDGFVMGEGAAVLILEDLERARARGACAYAEVLGYGTTNDAYHMTAPLPDGSQAARAVRLALEDAGLPAEAVDYVNAHASSTPAGDRAESLALNLALGKHARRTPVSGTKGLYGHPLGAAGAIEAAISALALHHGFLPGTANLVAQDAECDLELLPPAGQRAQPAVVLSTSLGFGGINAALVLGAAP